MGSCGYVGPSSTWYLASSDPLKQYLYFYYLSFLNILTMVALQTTLNAVILVCVLSDDPSSHLIPTYGEDLLASYSEPDQV